MINITIQSPQKEVVEKVLDVLKKREDFLGLFGYGSVFEEQRTASPTSDIDLIAVVDSSVWEFHVFQLDGIDVELFITDVNIIVNNVMSKDNHFEIRNIGAGKIVYSNDHVIEEIKRMADERYYKLGSFPLNKTSIFFKRVNYYDLLERVAKGQENKEAIQSQYDGNTGAMQSQYKRNTVAMQSQNNGNTVAMQSQDSGNKDDLLLKIYLMDYLVENAIEDWFSLYKRYYEKPTYHIADMKRFGDEFISEKCYEYYSIVGFKDSRVQGFERNKEAIQSQYDGNTMAIRWRCNGKNICNYSIISSYKSNS